MKNEFPSVGYHRFKVDIELNQSGDIGSSTDEELLDHYYNPNKKRRLTNNRFISVWDEKTSQFRQSNILKERKNRNIFSFYVNSSNCNCGYCKEKPFWTSDRCNLKLDYYYDSQGNKLKKYVIESRSIEEYKAKLFNFNLKCDPKRTTGKKVFSKKKAEEGKLICDIVVDSAKPISNETEYISLYFDLKYEDKLTEDLNRIKDWPEDYKYGGIIAWIKNDRDVESPYLAMIMDTNVHKHTILVAWYDNDEGTYNTDDPVEISRDKIALDPLLTKLRMFESINKTHLKVIVEIENKEEMVELIWIKTDNWTLGVKKKDDDNIITIDRSKLLI
jgi:hypothetical protein